MKKKMIFLTLIFVAFFLTISNCNAEEFYYQNNFGVILTKQEYDYISKLYWEGYQEYITLEDYNELKNNDLFNQEVKTELMYYLPLTRSTNYNAKGRMLYISKSCSSSCVVALRVKWNEKSNIFSYDVIGARTSEAKLKSVNKILVSGTSYSKTYGDDVVLFSNGFGCSILLPNVDNLVISATFYTTTGGTIYGSYQHATSNISESVSKQYSSLSSSGFGGVFDFTGTAKSVYDNVSGVSISV